MFIMKLLTKMNLFTLSIIYLATSVFSTSVLAQMSQEDLNDWLLNASISGDVVSVRLTLEAGASVGVTDEEGCTPLMHAFGYYECSSSTSNEYYIRDIIENLFDAGAELTSQEQLDAFLLRSVRFDSKDNIQRALEMGADINGSSIGPFYPSYRSPLMQASEKCNVGVARDLILRGAFINDTDAFVNETMNNIEYTQRTQRIVNNTDMRETALDVARKNCAENSPMIRLLQDAGGLSAKGLLLRKTDLNRN